jgi:hypothetical protein
MAGPRSVKEIREANGGLANLTDFEIAQHEFKRAGKYYDSFDQFAGDVGLDTGGKWGNRLSASVDSWQAGLQGVGEAVAGSMGLSGTEDIFRRSRRANEVEAQNARQLAQSQGAVMSYKDANSLGDYADWAGGMAVDSLPYLGEALAGGIAGRALLTGGRLGLSRAAAGQVGTTAASYPSAVGDILQNQRDENGTTDLGSAAVGGVPYALANGLFGLEGAIGRGSLARSGFAALDDLTDVRGALARTGATAGRAALSEGASETAQEGVNQYFGRMAVNPDETLFNPEANDRYLESFVGGATLGGLVGGGAGGWRRSEGYTAPTVDDPAKPTNLLGGTPPNLVTDMGALPPLQDRINQNLGLNLTGAPKGYADAFVEAYDMPSGVRLPDPETGVERELSMGELRELQAAQYQVEVGGLTGDTAGLPPTAPVNLITDTSALLPLQQRIDQNLGLNLPGAPKNYPSQFQEAASEPTNQWVVDPQTGMEHRLDIGQVTAIRAGDNTQLTPEQQNIKAKADELAAARTAAHNTFMGPAVDGAWPLKLQPREVSTYRTMDQLRQQGAMSQAAFEELAGSVQEALMAEDTKTLNKINKDITAELAKRQAPAQEQVQGDTPSTQQTAPAAQPTGLQLNFGDEATAVPGEAKPAPAVGLQRKATAPTTPFVPAAEEQVAAPVAPVEPATPVATEAQPTAGTAPIRRAKPAPAAAVATAFRAAKSELKPVVVEANAAAAKQLKALKSLRPNQSNRPKDPEAAAEYDRKMAEFNAAIPNRADVERGLLDVFLTTTDDRRISWIEKATGYFVDTSSGVPVLRQNNQPATNAQIAEEELFEGGIEGKVLSEEDKKALRAADSNISKWLTSRGLYKEVIDRLGAPTDTKEYSDAELGINSAEDAAAVGIQVFDDATKASGNVSLSEKYHKRVKSKVDLELKALEAAGFSEDAIKAAYARLNGLTYKDTDEATAGEVVQDAEGEFADAVGLDATEQNPDGAVVDPDTTDTARDSKYNPYTAALAEALADQLLVKRKQRTRVDTGDVKLTQAEIEQRKFNDLKSSVNDLRALSGFSNFSEAVASWNDLRSDDAPEFDNLPVVRQAAWAKTYKSFFEDLARGHITEDQFRSAVESEQRSFEAGAVFQQEAELERRVLARSIGAARPDGAKLRGPGNAAPQIDSNADVGTRAKAKLKSVQQNVAKADLTDEELDWAAQTFERLKNTAKAKEARAEQQKRAAAAPVDQAKAVEQAPATAIAPVTTPANDAAPSVMPDKATARREADLLIHAIAEVVRNNAQVKFTKQKGGTKYDLEIVGLASLNGENLSIGSVDVLPRSATEALVGASKRYMELLQDAGIEMPIDPKDMTRDQFVASMSLTGRIQSSEVMGRPGEKGSGVTIAPNGTFRTNFDDLYDRIESERNANLANAPQALTDGLDTTNPDIRYSKRAPKTPDGGFGAAERGTAPGETKVGYIHTTTDKQAFMDAYPGVAAAVRGLEGLGLRHIWDRVASIHVTDDATLGGNGALVQAEDGSIQLWLDRDFLSAQDPLRELISHELGGHLVDGGYGAATKGKFSGGIKWQVQLKNGKVTPVGAVARELYRLAETREAWKSILAYPLVKNKGMDANRVAEELFAQAAMMYISNPEVFAMRAPLTAAALQEAFKREAITKSESSAKHKPRSDARPEGSNVPKNPIGGDSGSVGGVGQRGGGNTRRNQKGAPKTGYLSKAPSELADLASGIATSVKDWTFTRGAFTRDLLDAAAKLMPSASKYLDRMQRARVESVKLEREVAAILDDAAALSATERGTGDGSVNSLIRDMTYDGKWAFKPDWLSGVTPDPVLEARFNQLSDKAQDVVMRVFRHGHETLKQVQQAATDSIKSEVEPLIAKARAEGDMKTVKELERAKVKADGKFRRLLAIRGGMPYAPLRRFGNWAVVVKSKMYQDAQARGDKDEMDRLAGDGNHYRVEFVSNRLVAAGRANRLREVVGDSSVEFFERSDENLIYGGDSMFSAFSRFRKLAREKMEGEESKVVTTLDKTLASMYMALVAETSARTSEFDRKNVAGADKDMLRSFATHGRAMANFIGSLKTSGEVMDILRVMKREAGEGSSRAEKSTLYNEILRRHSMGLNYEPNQLLDKSLAANSYWSLVTSPSYLLTNLTQPWVVSLPVLAGRFGMGRSSSEMFRAYKEIGRISSRLVDNPDAVKDLPKDVQGAVEELFNRGSIDISLGADLGAFTSGGDSKLSANMEKAIRFPRTLVERGEMVNRVATAVAAYRLAKSRGMKDEAAINYADKVIYETHGDYSAFNSPRVMRNAVGRFATQFRKFQLIQIALYGRMIRDSLAKLPTKGTQDELKAAAEARAIARRSLAYTLGTTFALGGLTALPGFTAISFLMGAFGDDDEPDDPEATLRRALGGGAEADLLMRGVPNLLGMNLGNRIGAAGMLSILPYTDLEASREGYKDILMGVAGPFFGGTLPKALDGLGLIRQGDLWKGLEMLAPRGLADVSKGIRFGMEGVTKRNGDVVLSGDEVSFFAVAAQAMGLPTTTITDNQLLRNSQFTADEFYKDRTSQLKRQYVQAYRSGDGAKLQEIRAEWQDTQQARRRLGFKVQPLSTLLKAPQEQRKREAQPLNAELLE